MKFAIVFQADAFYSGRSGILPKEAEDETSKP
jgi:hypothetical protein